MPALLTRMEGTPKISRHSLHAVSKAARSLTSARASLQTVFIKMRLYLFESSSETVIRPVQGHNRSPGLKQGLYPDGPQFAQGTVTTAISPSRLNRSFKMPPPPSSLHRLEPQR